MSASQEVPHLSQSGSVQIDLPGGIAHWAFSVLHRLAQPIRISPCDVGDGNDVCVRDCPLCLPPIRRPALTPPNKKTELWNFETHRDNQPTVGHHNPSANPTASFDPEALRSSVYRVVESLYDIADIDTDGLLSQPEARSQTPTRWERHQSGTSPCWGQAFRAGPSVRGFGKLLDYPRSRRTSSWKWVSGHGFGGADLAFALASLRGCEHCDCQRLPPPGSRRARHLEIRRNHFSSHDAC